MARSERVRPRTASRPGRGKRNTGAAQPRRRAEPGGRAAASVPEDRTEAGRRISGRALALGVVFAVIALMAAPTVNTLVKQERQILGMKREIAEEQRRIDELSEQKALWDDPDYIMQRAREDYFYVLPGEQAYVVIGGEADEDGEESAPDRVALPDDEGRAWPEELLNSIREAGTAPMEDTE